MHPKPSQSNHPRCPCPSLPPLAALRAVPLVPSLPLPLVLLAVLVVLPYRALLYLISRVGCAPRQARRLCGFGSHLLEDSVIQSHTMHTCRRGVILDLLIVLFEY
eukprot:COSAG02_NODE_3285_length_7007_cov_4.103503_4_plen_105_part_00